MRSTKPVQECKSYVLLARASAAVASSGSRMLNILQTVGSIDWPIELSASGNIRPYAPSCYAES
eukprot:3749829-Rhodomonas_salina.2